MMPAGIVRGALSRLGLIGVVVPEINNLPQCMLPCSFFCPRTMNRFQPPNRYIPDKAAKTLMNRLSRRVLILIDRVSSAYPASLLWQPRNFVFLVYYAYHSDALVKKILGMRSEWSKVDKCARSVRTSIMHVLSSLALCALSERFFLHIIRITSSALIT